MNRWYDRKSFTILRWFSHGFTLTSTVAFLVFMTHLIRIHSHVIDEVHQIEVDHETMIPRLAKIETRQDVVEGKLDLILADLKEIKRRLP